MPGGGMRLDLGPWLGASKVTRRISEATGSPSSAAKFLVAAAGLAKSTTSSESVIYASKEIVRIWFALQVNSLLLESADNVAWAPFYCWNLLRLNAQRENPRIFSC